MINEYWTLERFLFRGGFHYYQDEPRQVRALIHQAEEPYQLDMKADLDITPVSSRHGRRTYIHLRPYVMEPQVILTVGLYPQPQPDQSIGEVIASELDPQQPVLPHPCGTMQGWFYPDDRLLMLWECYFDDRMRDAPLREDANMRQLWLAVEQCLLRLFPAERIVTPFGDPLAEREEYQTFLRQIGYEQCGDACAAFSKQAKRIDLSQEDTP